MTQKRIGPSFPSELEAARLLGLPFSWGEDGQFSFDPAMTQAQIDEVLAVYEEHDPEEPAPEPQPTLADLQAQLAAITAQIAKLAQE